MKIISDITGKEYKSVEECIAAEEQYKKEQEQKDKSLSKRKKALSDAIEKADKELNASYEKYRLAKNEANSIVADANKKAKDILEKARNNVEDCSQKRMEAIMEFNKEFGAYKKLYTEQEAAEQVAQFNNMFDDMIRRFFFF